MNFFSQYKEEEFFDSFFNNKEEGFLVDVGAADGVTNSNSRHLILNKKWKGILVEPHPEYFKKLELLYNDNLNIKLLNNAAFKEETVLPFYIYDDRNVDSGQVSTISEQFKNRVINRFGDGYSKVVNIQTLKLSTILKDITHIDFLSIDCEGVDIDVINSHDFSKVRPKLIGLEHSMEEQVLLDTMNSYNYVLIHKTTGNSFFAAKKN